MSDAFVELRHLTRDFGTLRAVDDVTLFLARGEIVALLGPSGSGKTTLLRLLAGFERPDRGQILIEGRDITAMPPAQRRFGMVFQHYALFPHLDVGQNVAFGLTAGTRDRAAIDRRVAESLALVDLAGMERRRISQLSGGQQQRVALARALAPEPEVLLLDEPLSNLDPALRVRTRRELASLIHRIGITAVFVTHEQDEAFDLGDRVAVLHEGTLRQVGTPETLYEQPDDEFVARFIGRSSALRGDLVASDGDRLTLRVAGAEWPLPPHAADRLAPGSVNVIARPDATYLSAPTPGHVQGRITGRRFGGDSWLYAVDLGDAGTIEVSAPAGAARPGEQAGVFPSRRGGHGIYLFARDDA